MATCVQRKFKTKYSPIEVYMQNRESLSHQRREKMKDMYDTIILDGVVTEYGINRNGDVYSFRYDQLLRSTISQGKRKVVICYEKDGYWHYRGIWIDRLVALTYIPNPNNCKYIRHKNHDLLDDSVENVEWTNEKPNGASGYSRKELSDIFNKIQNKYYDDPKIISKKYNLREWVVIWIKMVIHHMEEENIEISANSFLSGFETPIIDGVPNDRYGINRFGVLHQIFGDRYRIGSLNPFGYTTVTVVGVKHLCMMHRIVAETFIPNPDNLPEAHHKNGITCDPCVWNLAWVTHQENMSEASYLGQLKRGIDRKRSTTYTDAQIHDVCKLLCEKRYPMDKISEITGVNYNVIKMIRRGESWQHISQYYNLPYVVFRSGKYAYEDKEKAKTINERIRKQMERSSYGAGNT